MENEELSENSDPTKTCFQFLHQMVFLTVFDLGRIRLELQK